MKKLISLFAVVAFSATAILPAAAAEPNELVPAAAPAVESVKPVHKAKKAKSVKKAAKAKHKAKRTRKHRR